MKILNNQNIILAITGGIAAYKAAELARLLVKQGADVQVVMSDSAQQFITPLTLQALTGREVRTELFDLQAERAMGHIELARWADQIIVAPASANLIAKLAYGMADDLLTTLCLATTAPLVIAPAMNQQMWQSAAVQDNIARLTKRGVSILGPDSGEQACGEVGPGRMLEPTAIIAALEAHAPENLLMGKRIMVTAGPTREAIDPVRYLSNASSGKMGYALAEAALQAGADVVLVSGPTALNCSDKINRIDVISAEQMLDAVLTELPGTDIFISTAAVADYRPEQVAEHKIKKQSEQSMQLQLIRNPDILKEVASQAHKPFTIGFAAETENLIANACSKLEAKQLDMIIANQVGVNQGFDQDSNAVTVITAEQQTDIPLMPKPRLAKELVSIIAQSSR